MDQAVISGVTHHTVTLIVLQMEYGCTIQVGLPKMANLLEISFTRVFIFLNWINNLEVDLIKGGSVILCDNKIIALEHKRFET